MILTSIVSPKVKTSEGCLILCQEISEIGNKPSIPLMSTNAPKSVILTTLPETIEVKIIKIDNELKRISLSLKRMGENPWQQIEGQFEEGQVVKGTVNKVTTFGAFINIFPGVEALLPVAEMSDENVNPFNLFKVGAEVDVLIKKFTPKEHRIALSIKDINA